METKMKEFDTVNVTGMVSVMVYQKCGHQNKGTKVIIKDGTKSTLDRICRACKLVLAKDVLPINGKYFVLKWALNDLPSKMKNIGNYKVVGNKIIYKDKKGEDLLGMELKGGLRVGNASRLRFSNLDGSSITTLQQALINARVPMMPFGVFKEAGLNVNTTKLIDTTGEEKLILPKQNVRGSTIGDKEIWKNVKCYGKKCKDKDHAKNDRGTCMQIELIKENLTERHFIGAMLMEVSGKQYLFDCDRRELDFYRFNAFLTQLPKKVKTIAEAYEILKPKEVLEAEKAGKNVLRQGEFFFVPEDLPTATKPTKEEERILSLDVDDEYYYLEIASELGIWDEIDNQLIESLRQWERSFGINKSMQKGKAFKKFTPYVQKHYIRIAAVLNSKLKAYNELRRKFPHFGESNEPIQGELRAGDNSPNLVEKYLEIPNYGVFVSGLIEHTGREHEDLELEGWYKPYVNTALGSFTITGDVD